MKNRTSTAVALLILGLLIGLGPQFLFKVCEPHDDMFMKCHWSAQAEIGIGLLIAALGIAAVFFCSAETRLGLTMGAFFAGIVAIAIPHGLIGGCPMPSMQCQKAAFPALTSISILLLILSALNAVYLIRHSPAKCA